MYVIRLLLQWNARQQKQPRISSAPKKWRVDASKYTHTHCEYLIEIYANEKIIIYVIIFICMSKGKRTHTQKEKNLDGSEHPKQTHKAKTNRNVNQAAKCLANVAFFFLVRTLENRTVVQQLPTLQSKKRTSATTTRAKRMHERTPPKWNEYSTHTFIKRLYVCVCMRKWWWNGRLCCFQTAKYELRKILQHSRKSEMRTFMTRESNTILLNSKNTHSTCYKDNNQYWLHKAQRGMGWARKSSMKASFLAVVLWFLLSTTHIHIRWNFSKIGIHRLISFAHTKASKMSEYRIQFKC